jgi:uncharacterized membrane-anchored protein
LGNLNATLVLGAALGISFLFGRKGLQTTWVYYWLTIVLIRSAGTAAGDFLAHKVFGLSISTLVSGIVFAGLLFLWREEASTRSVLESTESY